MIKVVAMKTFIVVLLSCIVFAAAFDASKQDIPLPRNEECASTCLWAGVYNVPSFQSCTQYLHCVHGFLFELECENGEEFDHLTLLCQPADEGRCVLEGPITSSEETSSSSSSQSDEV